MSVTQRSRRGLLLEPTRVTTCLEAALTERRCSTAEVERAKALWQEFLTTSVEGTGRSPLLSGSVESWCAALHYLIAPLSGHPLTQKAVAALYQTSASTLSSRVKLLKAHTDQAALIASFPAPPPTKRARPITRVRRPRQDKTSAETLVTARKLARVAAPPVLDESVWMAIFRDTHRLLSHLYNDKTHVEILHYLNHVELNMALAGYTMAREVIQEQFGRLFTNLGLQPAKGRDPHKFVHLQDAFGRQEPFVLLKLGYADG